MNQNKRLIQALQKKTVDSPPIWMMRQAGRYLPEYRKIRKQFPDFVSFCFNQEAVVEVTLQPLRRFDLDAAILFSDILILPHLMGCPVHFSPGEGPQFHKPIQTEAAVNALQDLNPSDLSPILKSIQSIKAEISHHQALIGFIGTPWTVAAYMVEGSASRHFRHLKILTHKNPTLLAALLDKLTQASADYLILQAKAGADVLMLFDSWASLLNPEDYQQFSLNYVEKIIQKVKSAYPDIPIIYFAKGVDPYLEMMPSAGMDALGLDWSSSIPQAFKRTHHRVALQGNLDPMILFNQPAVIEQSVRKILQSVNGCPGYIFNLGHGIDRDTPIENVHIMIDSVRKYHQELWVSGGNHAL